MNHDFLTQYDLDACASTIMARLLHGQERFCRYGSYAKLDGDLDQMIQNPAQSVIVMDLCLEVYHLEKLLNNYRHVTIYDHHPGSRKYTIAKHPRMKVFFSLDMCTTSLVFEYLNKTYSTEDPQLKALSNLVNVYDMWQVDHELWDQAYDLNLLFWKYHPAEFQHQFANGLRPYTDQEKAYIEEKRAFIREGVANTVYTELNKDTVLFMVHESELVNNYTLQNRDYKFYFMLMPNKGPLKLSGRVRRNSTKHQIDMNAAILYTRKQFLQQGKDILISCGGHAEAVGIEFQPGVDVEQIMEFLDQVVEVLSDQEYPPF